MLAQKCLRACYHLTQQNSDWFCKRSYYSNSYSKYKRDQNLSGFLSDPHEIRSDQNIKLGLQSEARFSE